MTKHQHKAKQILQKIEDDLELVTVVLTCDQSRSFVITGIVVKHPDKDCYKVAPPINIPDFYCYFNLSDVKSISKKRKSDTKNRIKYLIAVDFVNHSLN